MQAETQDNKIRRIWSELGMALLMTALIFLAIVIIMWAVYAIWWNVEIGAGVEGSSKYIYVLYFIMLLLCPFSHDPMCTSLNGSFLFFTILFIFSLFISPSIGIYLGGRKAVGKGKLTPGIVVPAMICALTLLLIMPKSSSNNFDLLGLMDSIPPVPFACTLILSFVVSFIVYEYSHKRGMAKLKSVNEENNVISE